MFLQNIQRKLMDQMHLFHYITSYLINQLINYHPKYLLIVKHYVGQPYEITRNSERINSVKIFWIPH